MLTIASLCKTSFNQSYQATQSHTISNSPSYGPGGDMAPLKEQTADSAQCDLTFDVIHQNY